MNVEKMKFTDSHEWIYVEGNTGTVGISDHAQKELGDIVFIETKSVGEKLNEGDEFGSIESVKAVSDLIAPISGEIIEINQELIDTPSNINSSPFEKGWIIKIKITNTDELSKLKNYQEYQEYLETL